MAPRARRPQSTTTRPVVHSFRGGRARSTMKLYALGDLHLGHRANREALADWRARPDDWLVLAGDVAESMALIELGLRAAAERFAKVFWVPGNHELWSHGGNGPRGVAKYEAVVEMCRGLGVVTPEDPYVVWPGAPRCVIAPLFLLYDYTFGPDSVPPEGAAAWAAEAGTTVRRRALPRPRPVPVAGRVVPRAPRPDDAAAGRGGGPASPRAREPLPPAPRPRAGCPASRGSASGAAPGAPSRGTCAIAPRWSWLGTCTCGPPTGSTGCGSRRCPSAIRGTGAASAAWTAICARFCRGRRRSAWRDGPVHHR